MQSRKSRGKIPTPENTHGTFDWIINGVWSEHRFLEFISFFFVEVGFLQSVIKVMFRRGIFR